MMDVFCCGMYRACSTWQYEVIAHLIEGAHQGERLGYVQGEQYAELRRHDEPTAKRPWRVLKSHEGDRAFARSLRQNEAYAVYAYRDVRDVVYSLLHKRRIDFALNLRQGMLHQVLVNHRFWTSQPRLLVQRYEDIITNPVVAVLEIAEHLQIPIDPAKAERIAAEFSLDSNRKRTSRLWDQLVKAGVDLNDPSNAQLSDNQTLLHWNHLRQGGAGDWSAQATVEHRLVFKRLLDPWLIKHGYEPTRRPDDVASAKEPWRARLTREWSIFRGFLACRTRCASLRFPRLSRAAKRICRIPIEAPLPNPRANAQPDISKRIDPAQTLNDPFKTVPLPDGHASVSDRASRVES